MTPAVVKKRCPWLIGEDPLRTDFLWQTVYARLRDHGQKGVDCGIVRVPGGPGIGIDIDRDAVARFEVK